MNFRLIFAFALFRTFEVVLPVEDNFECVTRKSGACKVLNITEDFDHFINLKTQRYGANKDRMSTIMEIDYLDNKYSYNLNKTKKQKELDTVDNPVVEILFSKNKDPEYSYRIVLGEKFNRLAYLEVVEDYRAIKYNNYSPELPSWPFTINVTLDADNYYVAMTELSVYTRNGDGFDKEEPFLRGNSDAIEVTFMSIRSRNKNVKLVGFYDCSTKYGSNCGTEKTQTITDCKEKFSPLGSGFFNNFVDMSKFNRLGKEKSDAGIFDYDEIFGIYRRSNDNMYILFTTHKYEKGTYIRITVGDEIAVHLRTYVDDEYEVKKAVKKGWNQEPSEPTFIRVVISSESKLISIYKIFHIYGINIKDDPILTMKLCNYFVGGDTIRFMSVTSNRFKTVDLFYDCCLPHEPERCHVNKEKNAQPESSYDADAMDTDSHENKSDSTTTRSAEDYTTLDTNESDATTMLNENISSTIMESQEIPTETTETTESKVDDLEKDDESSEDDEEVEEEYDEDDENIIELETLKLGEEKQNTYLDTRYFRETESTLYEYENGTSLTDYCPGETTDVVLMKITETDTIDVHEDEDDDDINPYIYNRGSIGGGGSSGGLTQAIRSLVG